MYVSLLFEYIKSLQFRSLWFAIKRANGKSTSLSNVAQIIVWIHFVSMFWSPITLSRFT